MNQPYIPAHAKLPEITVRVIILAIILALILGASNTYLALKIGFLTSASIPAAVISMGILRLFKNANILENNLVQTAASAGEAVAGGIVFTTPALIILGFWTHFPYWENFCIAILGGILGVIFSVPLRRILMKEKTLRFPEGKAIAALLQAGDQKNMSLKAMLWGGGIGALMEFTQTGLQIAANSCQAFFSVGRSIVGFGGGFSAALIGAGYLVGFNVGISILIGAIVTWFLGVPVLAYINHIPLLNGDATQTVMGGPLRGDLRFMGIGAMVVAGLWTVLTLLKPFAVSIQVSMRAWAEKEQLRIPRTERDLPLSVLGILLLLVCIGIYIFFNHSLNMDSLALGNITIPFLLLCLIYILIIGFILSTVCAYFSGLVGVSTTPGSSVIIVGMIITALLLRLGFTALHSVLSNQQLLDASGMTIIVGAIIASSAAIANDNIQDLKTGHLLGATPWKQQIMLIIGVIIAASISTPIMNLLFNVYGIGDVLPHAGMDPTKTLAAPPAAAMAAITAAVFNHQLPWNYMGAGAVVVIIFIVLNQFLAKKNLHLSILSIAVGMYLPLSASIPLVFGSIIALIAQRTLAKRRLNEAAHAGKEQHGTVVACGLVAGAALMDVILAIPFGMANNPDILKIMPNSLSAVATLLGWVTVIGLGIWFYKIAKKA